MNRSAWFVFVVLALWPHGTFAQQAAALNDKQLLGMQLFNQSCRVCHAKPQLTSPLYGQINTTRSPMRELQLGVKFAF